MASMPGYGRQRNNAADGEIDAGSTSQDDDRLSESDERQDGRELEDLSLPSPG